MKTATVQIKRAVLKECKLLKKYLTDEEKDRLSYNLFNPSSIGNCIYGMATGSCFSDRAIELKRFCAKPVNVVFRYNKPDKLSIEKEFNDEFNLSVMEQYIQTIGYGKLIINYLKGSNNLELIL